MILFAGGTTDPNIKRLIATADKLKIPFTNLITKKGKSPAFSWVISDNAVTINGSKNPKIIGCFIRHDVFESMDSSGDDSSFNKCSNWFYTVQGWLQANAQINILNRKFALRQNNKIFVLYLAKEIGFRIPHTVVSNEQFKLKKSLQQNSLVAKPVNGGGYCTELSQEMLNGIDVNTPLPSPAIVQEKLKYPEVRIYRIGTKYFAFMLNSKHLDYRIQHDVKIESIDLNLVEKEIVLLGKLTDYLGMDFAAADFKTCPTTGELIFLEVNSSPMFAAFDKYTNGEMTGAILNKLSGIVTE